MSISAFQMEEKNTQQKRGITHIKTDDEQNIYGQYNLLESKR